MQNNNFLESIKKFAGEIYTEEEKIAVAGHIRKWFGDFPNIFQEVMSSDIIVDVCVIPPENGRDYYTLVTMGMGAHKMNVPEDMCDEKLRRAELIITLPADWQIMSGEDRWCWPLRLLKTIARLPAEKDTWLGYGHIVDNGGPFAPGTELCGTLLMTPQCVPKFSGGAPDVCRLPGGDTVSFYHLIPVHKKEMEFKRLYGTEALLEYSLYNISYVVDAGRPDSCADWNADDDMTEFFAEDEEESSGLDMEELFEMAGLNELISMENNGEPGTVIDDAAWHIASLYEKKLPVDEINAYNHIAIYMRWCMEHDLMSGPFFFRHVNVIDDVVENGFNSRVDLRAFIRDSEDIKGCLTDPYFSETGAAFTQYYYAYNQEKCFPADVDAYAERYVIEHYGRERYESGEFKDEPYLFVPYTEEYYKGMKKIIDSRYGSWLASYTGVKNSVMQ